MEVENEGVFAQGKFMLLLYMIFFLAQNHKGPKTSQLLQLISSRIFVLELIFLSLSSPLCTFDSQKKIFIYLL